MSSTYSDRDLAGLNEKVSLGAGKAGLKSESTDKLKVVKDDLSTAGDLEVAALTVASVSGVTLAHLGVAVQDSLTSDSATDMLSAKQGKALKALIDAINTLLASDNSSLDDLQEIVDFIENNKDLIDALGVSNISGLQAALDAKLALAGGTMTGDLTMSGADVDIKGGVLKIRDSSGSSSNVEINFNTSNGLLEFNKELKLENGMECDEDIVMAAGKKVDGRDVSVLGERQDSEAVRKSVIAKDSGTGNFGSALAAGSLVFEVFGKVSEAFDSSATIEIGVSGDTDSLGIFAAEDLAVAGKEIRLGTVQEFSGSTQIVYKVNNGGSTGSISVYIKPML